jgi:hypothetical protein
MAVDENPPSSTGNLQDELETIIGIGPRTAAALSRIGIHRLEELAESTPDGLARALADGADLRVSPKRIEAMNWIGQARQRLAERKEDASSSPQADATAMPNDQASENQSGDWSLQAEFSLYFENQGSGQAEEPWQTRVWKTRVRDRECDKEKTFEGIEPRQWVNWILQQADLPIDVEFDRTAPETLVAPAPVTPNPTQVSIRDVEIEPQSASDVRNSKFVSAIHFNVSGANAETLTADNTPYQIIIHAVDLGSGVTKHVASERRQLQTGQSAYIHRLEQPIPDLKRYELQTIVLIQSQPELMTIYRGPTINVTP